jgi:hypothetical protein
MDHRSHQISNMINTTPSRLVAVSSILCLEFGITIASTARTVMSPRSTSLGSFCQAKGPPVSHLRSRMIPTGLYLGIISAVLTYRVLAVRFVI